MSRPPQRARRPPPRFPRVSGDEPERADSHNRKPEFSPRERG